MSNPSAISTENFSLSDYQQPFSLPSHWYHDPAIYSAEVDGIFHTNWLCAGHKSEFIHTGDFVRLDYCGESILVVRGEDDELRAFYNVCQHRGHILVSERRGNLNGIIRCPYHSWVYGLSGGLKGVPNQENVPGFPIQKICLPSLKLQEYGSFVWVNADPDAQSMADLMPGLDKVINEFIPDVEQAVFFEGNKNSLPINWKTQVDNAIDTYHFQYSGPAHKQLTRSMEFTEFQRRSHGKWLVEWGLPANNPKGAGYAMDPQKSRGEHDGFIIIWVYPDLQIVGLPVSRTFMTYRTTPFGPESTTLDYAYYGASEVMNSDTSRAAIDWMNGPLSDEDNDLTTGVHLGHKSRGFQGSHFLIDQDKSRYSEHPGQDFHRMVHEHTAPFLGANQK